MVFCTLSFQLPQSCCKIQERCTCSCCPWPRRTVKHQAIPVQIEVLLLRLKHDTRHRLYSSVDLAMNDEDRFGKLFGRMAFSSWVSKQMLQANYTSKDFSAASQSGWGQSWLLAIKWHEGKWQRSNAHDKGTRMQKKGQRSHKSAISHSPTWFRYEYSWAIAVVVVMPNNMSGPTTRSFDGAWGWLTTSGNSVK